MKTLSLLCLPALAIPLIIVGCKSDTAKDKIYDVKGTVLAVDLKKPSVKLDHEDIPGHMKAMVMDFDVESPKLLEGLKPGDKVQGKLSVDSAGKSIITHLAKLQISASLPDNDIEGFCPMHPTIVRSNPNDKCPICFMPLSKRKATLGKLSAENRLLVEAQGFCPISGEALGSMGTPHKLMIKDQPLFLCCKDCETKALGDPGKTLTRIAKLKHEVVEAKDRAAKDHEAGIKAALAKLSPQDRRLAESQVFCPVVKDSRLGSMGIPLKLSIKGEPVFLCCPACEKSALANADRTLASVKEFTTKLNKEYDVKGKVIGLDVEEKTVTLDHEDIPGLMKAMEMKFAVENVKVLAGIKRGDQVQARLKVKAGNYLITELRKR